METGELGSGGKIVRRRKAAIADSPYVRPRLPSPSPSPSPSPTPTPTPTPTANSIFSRLASGAGKVLSSIFGSGASSSSRFSSSDDEVEDEDGMDCEIVADSKEVKGSNEWKAAKPMTNNDSAVVNELIFQKGEAKFEIRKLLAEETFSREECTRLVKLIQSRVVDRPPLKVNDLGNGQNDACARAVGSKTASVRTWWSLPETRKSSVPFTFSSNSVNASSPGGFGLQADGLLLHNAAIMKARRWIEERKLESTMDNGPCTLNTDMLTHITENAMVSPVNMAKSYMRARPSWASPCLSDIGFRTPSPLGMQLFKDETPYAVDTYSLPSLKALEVDKRKKEHSESHVSHNSHTSEKQELSLEALNSVPEVLLEKEVKDTQKNVDNDSIPCDAPLSHSCITEMTLETKSSQPQQLFSHKDMDPGFISGSGVEDDMLQKGTNRLGSKFDANCSLSLEFSMSGLKDSDADMIDPHPSTERVIDGKLSHGDSIETCELLSKASIDVPSVNEMDSNIDGLENDCNVKSDEKMGLQPEEMLRALKRGKKAGGYYRRIKGKGSSRVTQRSM